MAKQSLGEFRKLHSERYDSYFSLTCDAMANLKVFCEKQRFVRN